MRLSLANLARKDMTLTGGRPQARRLARAAMPARAPVPDSRPRASTSHRPRRAASQASRGRGRAPRGRQAGPQPGPQPSLALDRADRADRADQGLDRRRRRATTSQGKQAKASKPAAARTAATRNPPPAGR
ncbi:MAG TPA: hypothetical protein DCQ73_02740 [Spirochaetaceae bacterium]|nr:hypothetical protein [Spirochaetaceae bacterium]